MIDPVTLYRQERAKRGMAPGSVIPADVRAAYEAACGMLTVTGVALNPHTRRPTARPAVPRTRSAPQRMCVDCGAHFTGDARTRWCAPCRATRDRTRRDAYNRARVRARAVVRVTRYCERCQEAFPPKTVATRRFCAPCKRTMHNATKNVRRTAARAARPRCAVTGCRFGAHAGTRFCGHHRGAGNCRAIAVATPSRCGHTVLADPNERDAA